MSDTQVEYQFHQCLGKGGYGEVYLATQIRPGGLQQKVAVKVLKQDLTTDHEAVRRLRDEGRMLATLQHPAILRAIDLCVLGGRIALVTEYVEGVDLSRCCKPDRLLAPRVVLAAIAEVAGALHTALSTPSPETGRPLLLIHRDIKPENIRLTPHGGVKLLDFGIARTSELLRDAKTRAGDLPFTPGYAAPESFRRGEQGAESDVYALGVTTYRLLVGERFYENMEVGEQFGIAALPEQYAPHLAARLQKAPANLRDLVGRMLAWEKSERPTAIRVRELCEDLIDRLEGPTIQKWARSVQFPPPRDMEGATLSGKTLRQEPLPAPPPTGVPRGQDVALPPAPPKPALATSAKLSTPTPTPSRDMARGTPKPAVGAAARRDPTPSKPAAPPPTAADAPTPPKLAPMKSASPLRAASTVAYLEEAVERHKAAQSPAPTDPSATGLRKPPPVPESLVSAARQVAAAPAAKAPEPTDLRHGPKTQVLDPDGLAQLEAHAAKAAPAQPEPEKPKPGPTASTAATAVRPGAARRPSDPARSAAGQISPADERPSSAQSGGVSWGCMVMPIAIVVVSAIALALGLGISFVIRGML
jgi:serine/threonine protein kinase